MARRNRSGLSFFATPTSHPLRSGSPRIERLEGRSYLSISFATPTIYGGVPGASGMAVADFIRNGNPDVVVAGTANNSGTTSSSVALYVGQGTGAVIGPAYLSTTGSGAFDAVAGDFNKDGKPDVAVSNPIDATVLAFLNNGDGTFQNPIATPFGTAQPGNPNSVANLAVGDFNGDAKLDLAVTDPADHQVVILTGNGDGTFAVSQHLTNAGEAGFAPGAIVAGDFNGDGKADLAFSDASNADVLVALNNGNGTFANPEDVSVAAAVQGFAVGDFNGDGKPDIAASTADANPATPDHVSLLPNLGDGNFAPSQDLTTTMQNPGPIAIGDFDQDGNADVAAMNSAGVLDVFAGNGNGTFQSPVESSPGQGTTTRLVAADLNADGKSDLLFTETGTSVASGADFRVLLSTSTGGGAVANTSKLTSALSATLPATVTPGEKIKLEQRLTLTNGSNATISGPISAGLYLSTGTSINSASIALPATVARKVRLKPAKHAVLNLRLTALPSSVPAGTYHLLAKVTDPTGTAVAAAPTLITVAPPRIDLAATFAKIPASVKSGRGTTAVAVISNAGTTPAVGPLQVLLSATPTGLLDVNATQIANVTKKINLKPGKSLRLSLHFSAPAAGSYFLIAQVDPNNLFQDVNRANNTIVSAAKINVA